MNGERSWTLKDTVVIAVLAVAFGALYMAWIPVWGIANGLIGPLALDLVYGVWYMAAITGAYIIRKPGVALGTELMAAAAEIPMGAPTGVAVLLGGLVQGLGSEAVFALTGWKRYSTPVLMLAGMGASVTSFVHNYFLFGYAKFPAAMLLTMLGLRLVSGAVFGGLVGKWVGDGLAATGSLRSFPLGRERAERAVGRV